MSKPPVVAVLGQERCVFISWLSSVTLSGVLHLSSPLQMFSDFQTSTSYPIGGPLLPAPSFLSISPNICWFLAGFLLVLVSRFQMRAQFLDLTVPGTTEAALHWMRGLWLHREPAQILLAKLRSHLVVISYSVCGFFAMLPIPCCWPLFLWTRRSLVRPC